MNYTLEKKLLASLLNNLEIVKRADLKSNWFQEPLHRQLAYTLLNSEKKFSDFSEIELEVKEHYPRSMVTEEWLHQLKFEEMFMSDFKASAKSLHEEFVRDRAKDASIEYAQNPSEDNRVKLEDWFRKMGEMEIDEDVGELNQPTEKLLHELENEVELGLRSYPELDVTLGAGLEGGMLILLAARPGMGKSAYAINLAIEVMQRQPDVQIDFFTLEMTKIAMMKRFVSRLTGINGYKFKNAKVALNDDEKRQVIKSADWLNQSGLRIHDSRFKLSEIERMIRQRKHEHKDKEYMAIIDYVGLIDGESPRMQRNQEVGKISRTLKLITNELNIPIILLSQLNRAVEQRDSKKPNLSDLRDSGDLEQDANVVGFLSQHPEQEHVITMSIAKNREGVIRDLHYIFHRSSMYFEETDIHDY